MTEQKVIEILAKQLRIDKAKITTQTNIASDLGADSLDLVELLMTLEDEFNVTVSDEEAIKLKTVDDIVKIIEANQAK